MGICSQQLGLVTHQVLPKFLSIIQLCRHSGKIFLDQVDSYLFHFTFAQCNDILPNTITLIKFTKKKNLKIYKK